VLPKPRADLRAAIQLLCARSAATVVMVEVGTKILVEDYDVDPDRLVVIPHGVPEVRAVDKERAKRRLRISGHTVICTFGLLTRTKGIDTAIRALPAMVARHPDTLYLIMGETHPQVRKREGESYRDELSALVRDLGVSRQVRFVNSVPKESPGFRRGEELGSHRLRALTILCPPHGKIQGTFRKRHNASRRWTRLCGSPSLLVHRAVVRLDRHCASTPALREVTEIGLQRVEGPYKALPRPKAVAPLVYVQQWLAHLSPEMTAIYARIQADTMRTQWEKTTANGIVRFNDGQPAYVDGKKALTVLNDNAFDPLRVRENRVNVKMPLGTCTKTDKIVCRFFELPCFHCTAYVLTPDDLPALEAYEREVVARIELAEANGQAPWAEFNRQNLDTRIRPALAMLRGGQTYAKGHKYDREYTPEEWEQRQARQQEG
jgi:hypothetical protein